MFQFSTRLQVRRQFGRQGQITIGNNEGMYCGPGIRPERAICCGNGTQLISYSIIVHVH
jgi:hypothetical protein